MSAPVAPSSLGELAEAVRSAPRVLAVGGGTKPRLGATTGVMISTRQLAGITEYDASEFTFTALAGTRLQDLAAALGERGQYLPFDPMLSGAGATLGGTIAAGLSGPGRCRFGGLRDFILGIRFVDGAGRLLRMGGKVVKNAAGFDLPKFFVGSLGRFGVLGECTFKVFPRPPATLTLKLAAHDPTSVARLFTDAANSRWEPDALDWLPGGESVCIRLAGPASAIETISREILARWPGETLSAEDAERTWSTLREFQWAAEGGNLFKIPLTPSQLPAFHHAVRDLKDARVHVSAGGNVAFLALTESASVGLLGEALRSLGLSALTLRGVAPLWLGLPKRPGIVQAVKDALDPEHRFPTLDD